jgi:hypothetical protein
MKKKKLIFRKEICFFSQYFYHKIDIVQKYLIDLYPIEWQVE